tara:strand:- start:15006 stop:15962 length:957 start_codon:yes stop_codon:yes gene_type:complete
MYKTISELYKDNPFPGKLIKYLDAKKSFISIVFLYLARLTLFGKQNSLRLRNFYLKGLGHEPKLIIDIGCGTGETTHILGKAFPKSQIIGIDICTNSINYAKKLNRYLKLTNVTFTNKDINNFDTLNFINNSDIIILSGSLHHFKNPKKILRFLYSKIKKKGYLIFGVYGRMFENERYFSDLFQKLDFINSSTDIMNIVKSLNIDRGKIVLNMKRENRFFRLIKSLFFFDLSYIGYVLFPHNIDAINLDGYANPIVHYYNPNNLSELINEIKEKKIEYVLPKTNYDNNIYYKKMNNYEKFLFCDANSIISSYTLKLWN